MLGVADILYHLVIIDYEKIKIKNKIRHLWKRNVKTLFMLSCKKYIAIKKTEITSLRGGDYISALEAPAVVAVVET